jgi:hypothetical protein
MKPPVGVRVLAVFLIVGGLVGIGLAVWMVVLGIQQPVFAVFAVLIAALFAFTCWQGLQLWKGTPGGYRWAKVLFAAQIPALSVGGLTYGFYTLLSASIRIGSGVGNFDFNLGSAFNLMHSPEPQPIYVGVNVVALVAFAYLMLQSRFGTGSAQRSP